MYSNKILFANLRSRQNPGNADKIGISGVDLCPLALIVFYAVIFGIIGEGFYNVGQQIGGICQCAGYSLSYKLLDSLGGHIVSFMGNQLKKFIFSLHFFRYL